MRITLPEKWIETAAADDRATDVAVFALENRLSVVFELLPLAADCPDEDMEYIHQLRVWSRRATAALSLYEQLIPRRSYEWMKKQLKRIRQAANYARDCDILILRLNDKTVDHQVKERLEEVYEEREHAQKAVVAMNERMGRDERALRRLEKLLKNVRERSEKSSSAMCFGDWARQRLRPIVEKFFRAVPVDKTDVVAMHQFRIRGKKLRYAMELLPGAFPEEFRMGLYPIIEAMQDRLGEINDLAMAKVRLHRKLELMSEEDAAAWSVVMDREQSRFLETTQRFWAWCTPEKLQELRDNFEQLLGGAAKREGLSTLELLPAGSD